MIDIDKYNLPNSKAKAKPAKTKEPKKSTLQELMSKDIELFNSFDAKKKEDFYTKLNILITAGLDIQQALQLIEKGQKKKNVKAIIENIREQVIQGASVSDAMAATSKFSNYEVFSIKIGEETGKLSHILKELSFFFKRVIQYRQQLMGALTYPTFVILFSFGVIIFLLNFLVPMFSGVYNRFDQELPLVTQQIVNLSDWLQRNLKYILLGTVSVIAFLYYQRKQIWFRKVLSIFIINIPIFGNVIKKIYLARFCQAMAFLLNSKVALLKTVELIAQMIQFYPIEHSLNQAEDSILNGNSLNETLEQFKFYPEELIALIKVGEEASQLDTMFSKLAEQYNDEVEQQTKAIGSLLEPILIIGLGVIVGFILIAMYMPLFQLSMGIQ
jgi:type IV pilus assembly protein PilC